LLYERVARAEGLSQDSIEVGPFVGSPANAAQARSVGQLQ
jgi:hypothetical protein